MEIRTNESGYDVEIRVCEKLLKKGIPACKFIPNKQGKMLSSDENGRRFTVSDFYDGITYAYNEAPYNMLKESAALLAKIHEAMKDMENIPVGIGADFFAYRKPEHLDELNERLCELSTHVTYRKKMTAYYDLEGRLIQYPRKKPFRMLSLSAGRCSNKS